MSPKHCTRERIAEYSSPPTGRPACFFSRWFGAAGRKALFACRSCCHKALANDVGNCARARYGFPLCDSIRWFEIDFQQPSLTGLTGTERPRRRASDDPKILFRPKNTPKRHETRGFRCAHPAHEPAPARAPKVSSVKDLRLNYAAFRIVLSLRNLGKFMVPKPEAYWEGSCWTDAR